MIDIASVENGLLVLASALALAALVSTGLIVATFVTAWLGAQVGWLLQNVGRGTKA